MSRDGTVAEPGPERQEELRLAREAARGDEGARREVVLRLLDRVRNAARYILRNDADADDAAQSAMVEILRCLGRFRGDGSLDRWASRITARTAVALARRHRAEAAAGGCSQDATNDGGTSAEANADGAALRGRLVRCLDRLPNERRETVVLRLIEGMTLEEIAEATGVPANTAKDRLRVGRAELRKAVLADPVLREALKERLP